MPDITRVTIDKVGSGDHVLVAGVPGEKIYIRIAALVLKDDCVVTFKTGASPLTGPMHMGAGGSFTLAWNQRQWVSTEPGDDLVVHLSENTQIGGALGFQQL